MTEMKITPKSTFPDSFSNFYSGYSLLEQVPILSTLYHSFSFLILGIILLMTFVVGIILKKYKDLVNAYANLQEANLKLALKN